MLIVPTEIQGKYAEFLALRGVAQIYINKCQKWLRYYLDFCLKYQYKAATSHGLDAFLLKLTEKGQNGGTRQEAKRAVQLYQDFLNPIGRSDAHGRKSPEKDKRDFNVQKTNVIEGIIRGAATAYIPTSSDSEKDKVSGSSWKAEFAALENTIRMRHYSDKTLKSYRKYIRDFQTYTRSPEPERLTAENVKDYLTHLAVKKKVAASTQNLAFNALLFFFRHVLNREFGIIDGVVRAKKKPYIPVVLSRAEIDKIFQAIDEPYLLIVKLLYGCGLRLFECLSLRVNCLNLDEGILTVHDGKGKKDRTVPLPKSLHKDVQGQLDTVSGQHKKDVSNGYDGVFFLTPLPGNQRMPAVNLSGSGFFPPTSLQR